MSNSPLDGMTQHCCACPGCDCPGRETAEHKCGLERPIGGTVGLDQGDGSTRPAQPPDAALPGDVERALVRLLSAATTYRFAIGDDDGVAQQSVILRHIAALAAQNAALVAERDALRVQLAAAPINGEDHED